jgi:hypothetical protein
VKKSDELKKFEELAKRLLAVPKIEVDEARKALSKRKRRPPAT